MTFFLLPGNNDDSLPLKDDSHHHSSNHHKKMRRRCRQDSSYSTTTTTSQADRHIQFEAYDTTHTIEDHVRPEEHDDVWYSAEYLQQVKRQDIKDNLRAQFYNATKKAEKGAFAAAAPAASIESDTQTWRGLEDVLEQTNRHDKAASHAHAVVRKYRQLLQASAASARDQSLRRFANALSAKDRTTALQLAQQDAQVFTTPTTAAAAAAASPHKRFQPRKNVSRTKSLTKRFVKWFDEHSSIRRRHSNEEGTTATTSEKAPQ